MKALSELQINTQAPHPTANEFNAWLALVLKNQSATLPVLVRLVDEEESQTLNQQFRGKMKPTNVLSFPDDPIPGFSATELGELVICAPVVIKEAQALTIPVLHHWAHLVIHGTLHLLGYDHENEIDANTMEALECELLAKLHIPSPYQDP